MSKLTIYTLISCSLFLLTCHQEEFRERPFPRLITNEITSNSDSGIMITATIYNDAYLDVQEYGLVYAPKNTNLPEAQKIIANGILNNNFSSQIKCGLKKDNAYYVRAYLISNNVTVYGNGREFISK